MIGLAINTLEILRLGVIGLGFLLAVLAFRLLQREQQRPTTRKSILQASYIFMVFSIVLCTIGLIAQLKQSGSRASSAVVSTPQKRTLDITRVDPPDSRAISGFRVTIFVNGTPYSYPTRSVWAVPGGTNDVALFPVVPADQYEIHAFAWIKDKPEEMLASSERQIIRSADLAAPADHRYVVGGLQIKYQLR